MGMPAAQHEYTTDMVRALNDQHDWGWPRYEVVDGELLVTPSPRHTHQRILARLLRALGDYLDREPVGEVLPSPSDISWGPRSLVQPDVFVVPIDEARKDEWPEVRQLLLAAEVLSPGSVRADRVVKRQVYQRAGVPLYWMVDAEAQVVETWTPEAHEARIERERLAWHPAGASTTFTLELAHLFRPV